MIEIIGAKGLIENIDGFLKKISSFEKNYNVEIQVFDADLIYERNHLQSAYDHAKRAFDNNKNSTNSLAMETLLYAAGERQLKIAIPKIGAKEGEVDVAVLFIGSNTKEIISKFLDNFGFTLDDKVLKGDINTLKKFGIAESEIKTVSEELYGDLILEKVAIVDIIK